MGEWESNILCIDFLQKSNTNQTTTRPTYSFSITEQSISLRGKQFSLNKYGFQ